MAYGNKGTNGEKNPFSEDFSMNPPMTEDIKVLIYFDILFTMII